MGFMDSIKEALGGDRDDGAPVPESAPVPVPESESESVVATTAPPTVEPKHVDPDAPVEDTYGIEATGGKHAARD
jgi:hypothetical protein